MIFQLALPIICSLMNRARGSQFYQLTGSTEAGRVLATEFIAAQVAIASGNFILFPVVWALLMIWCTPAWDAYWGAEIGQSSHTKLWGCVMMFLRQLLILPAFIAVAYVSGGNYGYCAIAGVLWLPYLLYGIFDPKNPIEPSEFSVGALIGLTFALLIG